MEELLITTGLSEFAECQGHSAKPNLHSAKALPSAALGKDHSVKNESAKTSLPSVFCRALGKVGTEKNPKNGNFYQKKWNFFLSMEAPTGQRPPFSDIFRVNFIATRPTRFEPETSRILYHYTTLSLVSEFRFSFQYIILNRV